MSNTRHTQRPTQQRPQINLHAATFDEHQALAALVENHGEGIKMSLELIVALEKSVEALTARVAELETQGPRRETRTHTEVAEREDTIVATVALAAPMALTPAQIAKAIGAEVRLVDSSCRKLVTAKRLIRAEVEARTPHYEVAA